MIEILGSIDNASINGNIYHLVFTKNKILAFQVMQYSEKKAFIENNGDFDSHTMLRNRARGTIFETISDECLDRGKRVESNINNSLLHEKQVFVLMEYSEVTAVVLSGYDISQLHSLSFKFKGQPIKYFLTNRGGRVPEILLQSYRKVLDLAFPGKWKMTRGARLAKIHVTALKTGALLAAPLSAVLFFIAFLQHATLVSAIEFAFIVYALLFIAISGVKNRSLLHELRRQIQ